MKCEPIGTCPIPEFDKDKWFMSGPRYLLWNGTWTIGSFSYTKKGKGRWQNHIGNINPTHWMYLPENPKGE